MHSSNTSVTSTPVSSQHSESLFELVAEAKRQVSICNACRYCEGFCSVFPALQRLRQHDETDVIQLANLCHNCRACHYSCQYSNPHEFQINLPAALADVRLESWHHYARPKLFSKAFQQHGVLIASFLIFSITMFLVLVAKFQSTAGQGFYSYLSHSLMVLIFTPAFIGPLALMGLSLKRYWQDIGGEKIRSLHLSNAFKQAATMKNLSGGQGQGCNFEHQDHYTNARRNYHHATVVGFLLCFASTSTATVLHYALNMPAPYAWYSLPKLFGVPGGILLVIGCGGLAFFKLRADSKLGAVRAWGAEMAFVLLLGATGLTGLTLYAATGTSWVSFLLSVHLACVFSLFILLPYSKMVHGFFRLAALMREEQIKQSQR